jgi:hypothetical protein
MHDTDYNHSVRLLQHIIHLLQAGAHQGKRQGSKNFDLIGVQSIVLVEVTTGRTSVVAPYTTSYPSANEMLCGASNWQMTEEEQPIGCELLELFYIPNA